MVDGKQADGGTEDLAAAVVATAHVERSDHIAAGMRDRHEHLEPDDFGCRTPHLLEYVAENDHLVGDRQRPDFDLGR